MHSIAIDRERPDFRVFIDLLYGHDHEVDTEGDSAPVNSRIWTHLFIADREEQNPSLEIYPRELQPLTLSVSSDSPRLEELAALYLFLTSGTSIAKSTEDLGSDEINSLKSKYHSELQRAIDSIWHKSSNELPYPQQA
jgi:hypothetical protein